MKLLITAACCLSSVVSFCQLSGNNKDEHLHQNVPGQTKRFQHMLSKNPLLANQQGNIALLPQDRMPCLVPDTAGMVPIPNAWHRVEIPYVPQHHAIPNPQRGEWSLHFNVLGDGALPYGK